MTFAILRFLYVVVFRFLGRSFFYLFKKRRKVAISNVNLCYKFLFKNEKYSHKKVRKIVKERFTGLGHTLADFLLLRWYTNKNIDNYVKVTNFEYLKDALAKNRGVILSTAHFGSWEFAAHYLGLKGLKSVIVYNKFKKPAWLDKKVLRQRQISGNTLLLKQNSFLPLYKHLKKGGMTILLTDQHSVPSMGEKVSFLGQNVWTHTSFIKLSLKTGAILVPGFMFLDGYSKYTIKFFEPIDPLCFSQSQDAIRLMARAYNKALESSIVSAPQAWMWQHRRFKDLNV